MYAKKNTIKESWRIWTLPLLVVVGVLIAFWSPIEIETLLRWGQRIGTNPWFWFAAAIVMAVLFTFGLPGSLGLWIIAPFNPPWISTILLVAASTLGGIGGYKFSLVMAGSDHHIAEPGKLMQILQRSSDLFTLTALRILPGFPHSAINFACGLLHVPLSKFILATIIGLSVKWGVYASAIYGITDAAEAGDAMGPTAMLPLFALVVLALIGAWLKRKFDRTPTA